MKTYTEKRFFEWHEDDISVTLRAQSGSYGGSREVFVICPIQTSVVPCVQETIRESEISTLMKEN